jgi:hypothetical protein
MSIGFQEIIVERVLISSLIEYGCRDAYAT